VGKRSHRVFQYVIVAGSAALVLCLGIGVTASKGQAKAEAARSSSRSFSTKGGVPDEVPLASASAYAFGPQDASQTSDPPVTSPSQPNKPGLPDGDGKQLATDYCQDCHSLTNITSTRKLPDEWRETVMTMLDRGARLPPDKVDAMVQYLTKNFAPKQAVPATADATPAAASPASSTQPNKPGLPDGDGKQLATDYCQDCHSLTNITSARKLPDEWRETVMTMLDRGARLPPDKVDALVQYLAKNFAPKQATPATAGATDAAPATPAVTPAPASSQTAELPDGDGKVLATQYCQTCHQLALVTKARKSADEWRQTVQKMVNYGSTLPQQDVDPLVRYFAKNLGAEK
jgi:mono/diheme cytochrome c family protein